MLSGSSGDAQVAEPDRRLGLWPRPVLVVGHSMEAWRSSSAPAPTPSCDLPWHSAHVAPEDLKEMLEAKDGVGMGLELRDKEKEIQKMKEEFKKESVLVSPVLY